MSRFFYACVTPSCQGGLVPEPCGAAGAGAHPRAGGQRRARGRAAGAGQEQQVQHPAKPEAGKVCRCANSRIAPGHLGKQIHSIDGTICAGHVALYIRMVCDTIVITVPKSIVHCLVSFDMLQFACTKQHLWHRYGLGSSVFRQSAVLHDILLVYLTCPLRLVSFLC